MGFFQQEISRSIWNDKYRWGDEQSYEDTAKRVIDGVYVNDPNEEAKKEALKLILKRAIVPAGRIWAGAGTDKRVTLINCFVSPDIQDSMDTIPDQPGKGIMDALKVAALTQQMGGGIGMDFSTIRPKGAKVGRTQSISSGVLPFMDMWHSMCGTVMSSGSRRGAMMGTLRVDHPDILDFIVVKQKKGRLTNFNISVLVTDKFMKAVENNEQWELRFNVPRADGQHHLNKKGNNDYIYKIVEAEDLWNKIVENTYIYAEPGIIFIDRINEYNNLSYCENIHCTNPCGEEPLPPDGDCNLGHVNLAVMVKNPFTEEAEFDWDLFDQSIACMIRFLDNVIDISLFPTENQKKEAFLKRRTGLGYTGLANALYQLGIRYGSIEAVKFVEDVGLTLRDTAYSTSVDLAVERNPFHAYDRKKFLESKFVQTLPSYIRNNIEDYGIRNGVLLTIAPTGTTSILMGNVSSGIEPTFLLNYERKVLQPDGVSYQKHQVYDYGYLKYKEFLGKEPEKLPDWMVTAKDLTVEEHLRMQAAAQKYIDASISKTINCPTEMSFEDFKEVYTKAYELGCKGCTTYRYDPRSERGEVLSEIKKEESKIVTKVPMQEIAEGRRYRIIWPKLEHALYVVITDYVDTTGQRRPFELFVHSKSVEHDDWYKAVSLLITAIFRREGDVSFVVEELKQVFSSRGGAFFEGKYVGSIPAALGYRIEEHLKWLGILKSDDKIVITGNEPNLQLGKTCPKCNSPTLFHLEGCMKCSQCGYSKCG